MERSADMARGGLFPRRLLPPLLSFLLLTGCGGSAGEYTVEGFALPALEALVDLPAGCSPSTDEQSETGATMYLYSDLSSGSRTACAYVRALSQISGYTVIDEDGAKAPPPDFRQETGRVLAGKDSSDGILRLEIQWDSDSCTISPGLMPEQKISQAPLAMMTVDEAVSFLRGLPPAALELPGASMDDYEILAEDGMVMVDNRICYCLNFYDAQTHDIRGTRLAAANGKSFYRLDRETDRVFELIQPRLYL